MFNSRQRALEWVLRVGTALVLAAGVVAALVVEKPNGHPDEWDHRVLDQVRFVEKARGHLFSHPVHVEFLTAAEYTERTRTEDTSLSDDEREEIEQVEGLFRALGLASGKVDLLEAENDLSDTATLAYYDSYEERVVVRGTVVTPSLALTLVHELTHALQDQVFDIDRYDDEDDVSSGEFAAFRALVEGDANRIENRYAEEELTDAEREALDSESAADAEEFESEGVPEALAAMFQATHVLGDAFITLIEANDKDSIDAAFADPPTTEEQLVDPFTYIERNAVVPMEAPGTDGAEVLDEGDFGAASLLVVLAERLDPRRALEAVTGWGGDAYVVFQRGGRTCARINVTGDSPADTDELAKALVDWVAVAPKGSATTSREGNVVRLESCDPGVAAAGGSGDSGFAVELAASRSYVAAGLLFRGATTERSQCIAGVFVNELDPEDLMVQLEGLSEELRQEILRLAERCP